jgi:hypothetical protein
MSIWCWGSPACYCQSIVAGSFIYTDLRSEFNTHLAPQALFRVHRGATATVTSFSLSKHTGGGGAAHTFSGKSVLLFMWEVGLPPVQWSFPPTATFTSFPALGCWAGAATFAFSSGLFIYSSVCDFPSPTLLHSGHPALFAMCLFWLLFIQFGFFLLFPWVGVGLSRGLCWSGPGLSVGVPHAA